MAASRRTRSLHEIRRRLFARALTAFDKVPSEEATATLSRLEGLNLLIETHESMMRRSRRLTVLASLAVASAAVLAAGSCAVTSARVEMRALATDVRFKTQRQQPVTDLIAMHDVAMSDIAVIDGPSELGFHPGVRALRIDAPSEPVVLEPVQVPAGTWVTLERMPSQRYRLTLRPPESADGIELVVSIGGKVSATVEPPAKTADPTAQHSFAFPRQLVARWSKGVAASLAFSSSDVTFTKPGPIDALQFERSEQVADHRLTVSALRSAEVVFPDYQRRTLPIAEAERVTLGGVSGYARGISAREDGLSLTFAGSATRVELGDDARENQLPSVLDYVTSRTQWVTLGSTIGALFAVVFAAWSWWRETE